jgi:hypothetical protein
MHFNFFMQIRLSRLYIYSVKKHLRAAVEDMYPGYMTEMTWQAHVGVGIGPYYDKMVTT